MWKFPGEHLFSTVDVDLGYFYLLATLDFGLKNLCAGVLVWISHSDSFWYTYTPGNRIVELNVKSMLNFSLPKHSAFPSEAFNIC